MIREYFVRGERKTVEEIDNVVAVKITADEGDDASAGVRTFGTEAPVDDTGMTAEEAGAFRNARWFFIEPSPSTIRALEAPGPVTGADATGKLVKRPNGRLGIVTKRLNVQLREDMSEQDVERVLAERGLHLLTRLRFAPNLFEVDTTIHEDALAASVVLSDDPRFTLAEPSLIEHVPPRLTPTDPRYGDQWQWANTGQNGGTAGADVHAEAAWDRTRSAGIRVAVIDNGFNTAHEDLQAGIVGASGFFRQVGVNPVTFVSGTAGMPGGDHGTFCAGMVGARQNNARGGCGAAPECDLMLIACFDDQVGTQTTLARAVSYAADPSTEVAGADPATEADILVSSLGPNVAAWDLTVTLRLALEFAAAQGRGGRGLAIFWPASNGNNVDVMLDEVVSHADVIAVVRSTRRDLEDNAARGPEVELIAPGVDVVSTTGDGGYGTDTGTSYAAPAAAGCAALALSMNPELTRDELRQIMHDSADKIGGVVYDANGHNDDYGFGRVNAQQAVVLAESELLERQRALHACVSLLLLQSGVNARAAVPVISHHAGTVLAGTTTHGAIELAVAAPPEGKVVRFVSSDPSLAIIPGVTIPAGQFTSPFSIQISSNAANTTVTLTAQSDFTRQASLDIPAKGIQTLSLGTKPDYHSTVLGLAASGRYLYATHYYSKIESDHESFGAGELVTIDGVAFNEASRAAVGYQPRSVAVNPQTNRIYVVNYGQESYSLSILDGTDPAEPRVIAHLNLGPVPTDVAVNPRTNRVFVTNPFQRKVHVIDGDTNSELGSIEVGVGLQGLAVEEETNRLYVAQSHYSSEPHVHALTIIQGRDKGSFEVLPSISVGADRNQPIDVAINARTNRVYMASLGAPSVPPAIMVLDRETHALITSVRTIANPHAIAVNPGLNHLYIGTDGGLQILDAATNTVVSTAPKNAPWSVVANLDTGQVFYGSATEGTITEIPAPDLDTVIRWT